jgi:DNA invertase Pin-like site-specific DNA recombinase
LVGRLGRSLQDLVGFLSEIHASGVDLFLHQQGIDTTTPGGKAMFQMLGVFAEFERAIIRERVRAGLRRAKAEGKKLGRPRIAPDPEGRILAALKTPGRTEGVRKIAKRFGVDPGTVQRIGRPFDGASAAARLIGASNHARQTIRPHAGRRLNTPQALSAVAAKPSRQIREFR